MNAWLPTLTCALGLVTPQAGAESYPVRPIRLVVGFPAGGGVDLVSRQLAEQLSEQLAQQVTVENRPGAAGNLASEQVARGEPDGYTLMVVNPANIAINPGLYSKLNFDPNRDFAPVARMVVTPLLAAIPSSIPAKTMGELIQLLRSRPGAFSYGSGGVGNINHLGVELFKMKTRTQMNHVPAESSSKALGDLIAGRVQFMMDGGHVLGRHVQEGTLRVLATFSKSRSRAMPDVPTAREAGLPDLAVSSWLGVVAPAATPAPVVARLQKAIERALSKPEFRDRLMEQGTEPAFLAPAEFRAFIAAEQRRWAEVLRVSGTKTQ